MMCSAWIASAALVVMFSTLLSSGSSWQIGTVEHLDGALNVAGTLRIETYSCTAKLTMYHSARVNTYCKQRLNDGMLPSNKHNKKLLA